ncbi:dynein assembly factor 6, axonemal [Nilaparvata lugens]|uniref:dynein assembly factor 6, axonemal n=1 Tax=Nilaparvata lugens TaxID=108931 RepID=UPI00193D7AF0|nr:dynein assembly factor 6, axonemal [Nilaparvata lugens]
MDSCFGTGLKDLSRLLSTAEPESDSDDDLPKTGTSRLGPGDVKPKLKVKVKGVDSEQGENATEAVDDPKAIWQLHEVTEVPVCDDASYDPRQRPEYDIKYKQAVTAEDIYLQMGRKTTASSSCEMMVLDFKLANEQRECVDLQVSRKHLDIRSPLYRLSLPLPHPVNPDKSTADWDPTTSILSVSLFLDRELDYVNF